jgi:hypothetical protein
MKNLKRSARVLNTILNICFWLLLLRGIYAAGFHCLALYKIFTDPAALTGSAGLSVDWLVIEISESFRMDLDAAIPLKLVQLICAIAITVITCMGIRALKGVLLPIELGQPFRSGISADIGKLIRCAVWLGMAENLSMLATVTVMERYAIADQLLLGGMVTGVSAEPAFRPAWFIAAAVLEILALVFRHAEQLQQLADETL